MSKDFFYVYEVMGIEPINHQTIRLATFSNKKRATKWAEQWEEYWEQTWVVDVCVFVKKPF